VDWALLRDLSEQDAHNVMTTARRRTFARGEVVFHRGDPADTLHMIRRGRFAARVVTSLGDSAIFAVLGPGEFFGELALLSESVRSATVSALEPAETLAIHRLDFERIRRASPGVSDVLIAGLVIQVHRLSEQLVEALYLPVERRVLRRLHELAGRYRADDDAELVIPLTQEDIASLAGTSRATVNKVLREQERRGVVELRRGRTVILEPDALEHNAR
jgi:CRP/FNR family cyclic AMP-dependent transcriptional regulator